MRLPHLRLSPKAPSDVAQAQAGPVEVRGGPGTLPWASGYGFVNEQLASDDLPDLKSHAGQMSLTPWGALGHGQKLCWQE